MKAHFNSALTLIQEKEITNKYQVGESTPKLAKEYKVCHATICKILQKNGVRRRTITETLVDSSRARKYCLDESTFDKLDTEQKAYIYGLLLADGWVYNKTYLLGFSSTDIELVQFVKQVIKSSHPIVKRKKKKKTHKQSFEISISSKKLWSALTTLGCIQNKTFFTYWPKELPNELGLFFILGLIDGDGCIRVSKNRLLIDLIGTQQLLLKVSDFIYNLIGYKANIFKHGRVFRIIYTGKKALKLRDLLYKNSTMFLARKKEIAYLLA